MSWHGDKEASTMHDTNSTIQISSTYVMYITLRIQREDITPLTQRVICAAPLDDRLAVGSDGVWSRAEVARAEGIPTVTDFLLGSVEKAGKSRAKALLL